MSEEKSMADVVEFLSGMALDKENVLSVYSAEDYVKGELKRYFNVHLFDTEYFIRTFPSHNMGSRAGDKELELFHYVGNVRFFTLTSRREYAGALSHQEPTEK